jgi:undecaprenyl-diphosphatase
MIALAKSTPYVFIFVLLILFKRKKQEALFAIYSATLGIIISKAISFFYYHNRPFVDNIGITLINHKPDSSFPSDHTTFLFAIAISLYLNKYKYSYLLIIFAILGAVARIFVGVHYPFDILGGIIIGTLSALVVKYFQSKLKKLNTLIFNSLKF